MLRARWSAWKSHDDGTLYAVFENGARLATYRIPLANVASPDNLQPLAGNVFASSVDSGDVQVGFAGEGGFGTYGIERTGAIDGGSRLRADCHDRVGAQLHRQFEGVSNGL